MEVKETLANGKFATSGADNENGAFESLLLSAVKLRHGDHAINEPECFDH